MWRIAKASLIYHKKSSCLFLAFSMFAFVFLFLCLSLPISSSAIYKEINEVLHLAGYHTKESSLSYYLNCSFIGLSRNYETFFKSGLILLLIVYTVFFLINQKNKQREYYAWLHAGSSLLSWTYLQVVENLLLSLIVCSFGAVLLFLFQGTISDFLMEVHGVFLSRLPSSSLDQLLSQSTPTNTFIVQFPSNASALLHANDLSYQQWLHIFFHAYLKTIRLFFLIIFSFTTVSSLLVAGWRGFQWNKKNQTR